MKSFRLLFPKAGIALFVFMFAIFSSASIFGAATITNIVITPASPIPGQAITIDFDISVTNGQRPRFAIALSDKTTLNFCGQDWIASKKGIYKNQTTWWYDGVAKVSTGVAITDTNGPDNNESLDPGVNGDGTLKHVKVISAIPPEKSGNMYIIIIARGGDALNGPRYQCSAFNSSGIDTIAVSAMFTVTGTTTPYKLNLEMLNSGVCLGTNTGSKWNQNYKITNWSESGIFLSNLKIRYWINDTHAWTFNNQEDCGYSPAGAQVPNNNINTAEQNDTFNNAITASCESGTRIANKYFEFGWNAAAGTHLYVMIAPNGGYVTKIQAW